MDLYDVNFRNPTLYSIFDIRNLFYLLIYKKYSFAYSSILLLFFENLNIRNTSENTFLALPNRKKKKVKWYSDHKEEPRIDRTIQNRDKNGTISLIFWTLLFSSANHYILFGSSIDRCKNISKYIQRRGKTKGNGVALKVGKIDSFRTADNPESNWRFTQYSETISLVFTGLYGSYGFVVTMVVAEW